MEAFDIKGLSKSPAIFDINKLRWMNGEYIRKLDPEDFHEKALPYYKEAGLPEDMDLKRISSLIQTRVEVLNEIPEKVAFLKELPEYDADIFVNKKSKSTLESSYECLPKAIDVLKGLDEWTDDAIHKALFGLKDKLGVKTSTLLWPVRIAASGQKVTPGGAIDVLYLLGKEEAMRRLETGLEKLEQALK